MSSKIHTTQQGKKCKKCLAKGGPCHLHCGPTPSKTKKASPKRISPPKRVSPPKSSSPSKNVSPNKEMIAWMDMLPKPALYKTLLAVKPESLNAICITSRRAAEICKSKMFQEEYMKHNTFKQKLLKGDLTETDLYDDDIGDYWGMQTVYKDKAGNVLIISTHIPTARDRRAPFITRVDYIPSVDRNNKIVITRGKNSWFFEIIRRTDGSFADGVRLTDTATIQTFLKKIHRSEWKDFQKDENATALEFIEDIKTAVEKTGENF